MRKRVKIIMFIVALSFVAGFLLSEIWQMLRFRARGGRGYWEKGIFGKVGKKTITREEYQNTLDYFTYKFLKENKVRDLSEEDRENLHNQVWQYLISEKVWADILKQEKIKVTDAEIYEIMKANPPPELRENPELMTDGKFDQEKYLQVLSNPQNRPYFMIYARELVDMLPKEKLRIDITGMYRVTSGEIQKALALENTKIKATFLYFSPKVVKDQSKPTEKEIKEYYERNKKEFAIPEMRRLKYVFFPRRITAEDSLDAQRQIEDIYNEIKPGEDFALLIRDFSDNPTETTATWYAQNSFDSIMKRVLDSLQPGRFSKPFLNNEGWQIVNLVEKKKDSVKLNRILIKIKMTSTTTATVLDSINKFLERAQHENFDTLCQEFGLMARETRVIKGRPVNFPGLYSVSPLQDFALRAKPKDLSEPMRGRGGYYVFRLEGIDKASYQPLDRIKQMIEWRIQREKDKEKIKAIAEAAYKKLFAGKTFADIVSEDSTIEIQKDSFNSFTYAKGAKGAEFAGALYALKPNETSGVVTTDWGSFIIHCDERIEVNNTTAEDLKTQRHQTVTNRLFSEIIKTPEVFDYRNAYFY
ncbi:MAG: peptidyl-prolyl cis-trans isomerase [candidate division WOR-3 bacterium]